MEVYSTPESLRKKWIMAQRIYITYETPMSLVLEFSLLNQKETSIPHRKMQNHLQQVGEGEEGLSIHVSCTDGKISVRINLSNSPIQQLCASFLQAFRRQYGIFNILSCPSQETEEISTLTRHVENVLLTTKGLQERNSQLLDGATVRKQVK